MGPQLLPPLSLPAWRATQIEPYADPPSEEMADETVYHVFDQPEDDRPRVANPFVYQNSDCYTYFLDAYRYIARSLLFTPSKFRSKLYNN